MLSWGCGPQTQAPGQISPVAPVPARASGYDEREGYCLAVKEKGKRGRENEEKNKWVGSMVGRYGVNGGVNRKVRRGIITLLQGR